ncbi:alpha/beta fold hydrolase [Flavobacterium silvaticum]|uniref:Alpha/beta hydrolase n=1 Tax=Flavobacterium silvaticum TaxID=1852020 RepID=A0A972FT42_9FLAO|nr:alpha/beta hydrolase [Flavobacterium silvaticum]NMH28879.1 alpha/beta hydrolase [Flavobacterium silvaticum]
MQHPGFSTNKPNFLNFLFALVSITLTGCSATKDSIDPEYRHAYLFHTKKEKQRYLKSYAATLDLFPVKPTEADVPTRFGTAHVLVMGDEKSPPLILLHGMDASSTMWYPNMEYWSHSFRVIAIDYIMDAGKSVLKNGPLRKQEIALFYSDVFDQLKIKKASVLGTSRGGWIACYLALKIPERVENLVLMSPAQVCGMVKPAIWPAIVFKMFPTRNSLKNTLAVFATHPEKIEQAYKDQFLFASQAGNSKAQITHMTPFSGSDLEKIKIPVLYMVGSRDVMNGKKAVRKAKKYFSNMTFVEIPDSGHFMSTDQPEEVNRVVSQFLSR